MTSSKAVLSHSDIASPPRQLIPMPMGAPCGELVQLLQARDALLSFMPTQRQVFDHLQDSHPFSVSAECVLLRHDLSAYIHRPTVDLSAMIVTERNEAKLYQQWLCGLDHPLQLSDIQHLNALATGGKGALRTTSIYLASHDGVTRLPMVGHRQARQRMTELPALLNDGAFGTGLLAAVRVLALVNNAHAFSDGNGRLGRFLFNYCLHLGGMSAGSYVPLKCLATLSEGGYEIRLREVELFGHWASLVTYHSHAMYLVHQWGQLYTARCSEQEIADVQ